MLLRRFIRSENWLQNWKVTSEILIRPKGTLIINFLSGRNIVSTRAVAVLLTV